MILVKQLFKQKRHRDNGWPAVKGKTVLPANITAAAGAIELFQNGDFVAHRAEPNRGSQATEARPHHNRCLLARRASARALSYKTC